MSSGRLIQREEGKELERRWAPRTIDLAAALFIICYVIAGSLIYCKMEGWSSWNSVYFCIITLSTVGYGDMSPTTKPMRIFTIFYVYLGLVFYATVIGSLVGREAAQQKIVNDARSSWPSVPIDVRPSNGFRYPIKSVLHRKDITRRWINIVKVCVSIFIVASIATVFFSSNEDFSATKAVYFTMVTMSTVGYGDIKMNKPTTKVFDILFVLITVPLMISFVLQIGALFSKKMKLQMFDIFCRKGVTMEMMRAIADPRTGKIQRTDFLAYMLLHQGKVKCMDLNKINKFYDRIDFHGSGAVDLNSLKSV